jgi:ATP-binding cassette, subfamily B, bacterial
MQLIIKYLKQYKGLLVAALVLATVNIGFSMLDPQIFRLMIDNYALKVTELTSQEFIKGVGLLLLGFIGVAFVSRVAKNFQDYFVNVITQRMGTKMYADSVEHSFKLPFATFEDQRSGELLDILKKARLDAQDLIQGMVNTVFLSIVGILFAVVYAFTIHPSIGIGFFIIIPILGIVNFVISKRIKEVQKNIVAQTADLSGSTTETLRNVELVKSMGLETQEIERLNNVNEEILILELEKIKLVRKLSFIQGTSINAVRAMLIMLMFWLIFQQIMTLGEYYSLLAYSFFIFSPLAEFGNVATKYYEARASAEKLADILAMQPETKPADISSINKLENIAFDKVSFEYNGASIPALKNINFDLKSGETIAFVGPSGSGKSTTVKLLSGLYQPSQGRMLINSQDSIKIDFDALKLRMGLVAQETQLFAGTIRENLLFVKPGATDEECLKVLEQAAATSTLKRALSGLDTKIGEGGLKLSGGERQRLAIARALLREPDVIIFDEATSSLDSITEKEITETIKDISQQKPELMMIIVAHRLSTIAHVDRIYVFEKGSVIESGTHENLIKQNGLYHALWRQQMASTN